MKIHKILYYLYIHVQSVKTYNWTVHEYKCLFLAFILLRIERESGKQNLGIKEKCPQSYLSYFRRGSTGESFFFHGLIDFVLFLVLAWGTRVSHVSAIFLSSTRSKMAMVRLPAMNPAQKLTFLSFTSAEGKGAPTSVFGFSLFPLPMSGDLRSLSTNICLSPLWPTFLPNGHLFDGLILSIPGEDSISLTSIVSVGYHVTQFSLA